MKQILINSEELEKRIALVQDGQLEEYHVEREEETDQLTGCIFKGRIQNLEPSLQAAFVDIGQKKNAFLHYWDMLSSGMPAEESAESNTTAGDDNHGGVAGSESQTKQENRDAKGRISKRLLEKLNIGAKQHTTERTSRQKKGAGHKNKSSASQNYTIEDIPEIFTRGTDVLVQVTKGPIGNKGARLTTNITIPGRYLVLMPQAGHLGISQKISDEKERTRLRQILRRMKVPHGMGLICRTAAAGRKERFLREDLGMLLTRWRTIEQRTRQQKSPACVYAEPALVQRILRDIGTEDVDEIVVDAKPLQEQIQDVLHNYSRKERTKVRLHKNVSPIFSKYQITEQIENIFLQKINLPSGGHIYIDETEALIAIDVNTGKNRTGKDQPETIRTTNLEAVEEIARQLRLRNIGGLVVLDLIDMESRQDRQKVYKAFKTATRKDRAHTRILPISELGLIEMTRQREQESLRDRLMIPCPYCNGKAHVKSPTSVSVELQRDLRHRLKQNKNKNRIRVTVHPDVLKRLKNKDAKLIEDLESECNANISFRGDPNIHIDNYQIQDLDNES